MNAETLLIELLTEELPPKALQKLAISFAKSIVELLMKENFIDQESKNQYFATPKRLAVSITDVKAVQQDQIKFKKGPAVAAAIKDGVPTKALEGFIRANNTSLAELTIMHDGKQDIYCYQFVEKGQSLEFRITDILEQAIKKLPVPKVMHWGDKPYSFVRPVHGLMVMLGKTVLNTTVLGINAQNSTLGHRFLSHGKIVLDNSENYEEALLQQGKVVANFQTRKQFIIDGLQAQAQQLGTQLVADESLFDEVTALVEWPVILQGKFEEEFLQIPPECLILTMQQNQKYFPLRNQTNELDNQFLLVANLASKEPEIIIQGNERVLRARLSDAVFFYQQDKKTSLISRVDKLKQVVYHNKIGSQFERVARLQKISQFIAEKLNIDTASVTRAALLAKADLVTDMVGEFPELQGIMGKYYALNDKESVAVANAIEQHYWPKLAGGELPQSGIATAVALADKLETLIAIWGIGLIPTGDKDPYALRRASLGIIRMLMNYPLDLKELLSYTASTFPAGLLNSDTAAATFEFIQARLAVYLTTTYDADVVSACLVKKPSQLNQLQAILAALLIFKKLPEAQHLASTNKRVLNILKKEALKFAAIKPELLIQQEEKELALATEALAKQIKPALAQQDYQRALSVLAEIKPKVDAFFEHVMVMVEDESLKQARLNILYQLSQQLNAVADISLLSH